MDNKERLEKALECLDYRHTEHGNEIDWYIADYLYKLLNPLLKELNALDLIKKVLLDDKTLNYTELKKDIHLSGDLRKIRMYLDRENKKNENEREI